MNCSHRGHLRPRSLVVFLATAAVVAISVTGCSVGDKATPKASGSKPTAGSTGASPGALKDQSAAVLSWTPPAPVAKTQGQLDLNAEEGAAPATAEIISVQASDISTILTWQLSTAADLPVQGPSLTSPAANGFFPSAVRLIDPVAKKSYAVNTMKVASVSYCVCATYPLHVGPDPVRMTAEYPALPATVTSVSVRIPKFAPVTVVVTR